MYMMLLERFDQILAEDLAAVIWLDKIQIFACLVLWLSYFFCLYVKIFLPSIFSLFEFWNSMSLIVLYIELTEKNITKEMGLFLMALYKEFHFVQQGS